MNNSHTYQFKRPCVVHLIIVYLMPQPLHNPDYQCQFNKTGVLCGRCKEGLITVFGASQTQCKQCSNYYLFFLIAFIFAAFISVIILSCSI